MIAAMVAEKMEKVKGGACIPLNRLAREFLANVEAQADEEFVDVLNVRRRIPTGEQRRDWAKRPGYLRYSLP
jgi:hypothetical protein